MLPVTRTFNVAASPEMVIATLRKHVSERSIFSLEGGNEPFRGTVGAEDFKFSREINYKNSFLPVIAGKVKRSGAGSEVSVVMRLDHMVFGFMIAWLSFPALGIVLMLTAEQTRSAGQLAIPFGMLTFGLLLATLPFKFEAKKAERLLSEIFAAL